MIPEHTAKKNISYFKEMSYNYKKQYYLHPLKIKMNGVKHNKDNP